MGDEFHLISVPVTWESKCNNSESSNSDLEFFSSSGVVKLETLGIPFAKLSYSVVTSATGTSIYLFHPYILRVDKVSVKLYYYKCPNTAIHLHSQCRE